MKLRRQILISHNFSKDCSGESASFQKSTQWDAVLCTPETGLVPAMAFAHAAHPQPLLLGLCRGRGWRIPTVHAVWEGCSVLGGFLQSAASVRSEPPSTEPQHLTTASICLCDQNSSARNCSCEWQLCLRGCVRSLPPAALPVKSKCNLL